MSKFPIICGIVGKKLYLTILLTIIYASSAFFSRFVSRGYEIPIIIRLGGSILEMLSILIPYIFKFKSKSDNLAKICTKAAIKDELKD